MAKKKILVVDDEIDFTELMKLRLEANDYDVLVLNSGEGTLDSIKKEKPGLRALGAKLLGFKLFGCIRTGNAIFLFYIKQGK